MTQRFPRPLGRALAWLLIALAALAAGCAGEGEEKGVVARVNERPIYLHELESKYDMMLSTWAATDSPNVEKLQSDYGMLLGELIVQALVDQTLEAKGLAVTPEELEAAEADVRSDYPDQEAFEQVLVEEYIDISAWRDELRARLAMKKFFAEVLRPRVKLNYQEAEAYYRQNIRDFYLPPRFELVVIRGPSRDAVNGAVEHFLAEGDADKLASQFNELTVERVKIREDRLTMEWKNAVNGLNPGEAGPVLADDRAFTRLVFLDKSPAHVLEPSRAYPIVERVLLEKKVRDEFEVWLAEELLTARIEVSPHLDITARFEEVPEEDEQVLEPLESAEPQEMPAHELAKDQEMEEAAKAAMEAQSEAEGNGTGADVQ